MIPPLKLREWTKAALKLDSVQISELQRIDGIRIEARADGRFDVTPTGNMVGYVRRGSTSVVIHPSKCDSDLSAISFNAPDCSVVRRVHR